MRESQRRCSRNYRSTFTSLTKRSQYRVSIQTRCSSWFEATAMYSRFLPRWRPFTWPLCTLEPCLVKLPPTLIAEVRLALFAKTTAPLPVYRLKTTSWLRWGSHVWQKKWPRESKLTTRIQWQTFSWTGTSELTTCAALMSVWSRRSLSISK